MDDVVTSMAKSCFGYGRWEAPHWFIGLEEGQSREENDDLSIRAGAWQSSGSGELSDCRDFHESIKQTKWHQPSPPLQKTWRPLMLLLMTYLERSSNKEHLRSYQRDHWGTARNGAESCVIELSGLPASSLGVSRERETFRQHRIKTISMRLHTYAPALVVMYGMSRKADWETIVGQQFPPEGILRIGKTSVALMPHPNKRGLTNADWTRMGEALRQ